METLPLAFTSGWASGINAYLVVLVLGVVERVSPVAEIPDVLARWEVIGVAAVFFVMEFIADKVPLIDSTWDAFSTAVRPTIGAVLGYLIAEQNGTADTAAAFAAVGGGTALLTHLVKAGTRLAINTSPEPLTNVGVSLVEDSVVFGMVWFAVENPEIAATIAAVALLIGIISTFYLIKVIRRGWEFFRRRPPTNPAS